MDASHTRRLAAGTFEPSETSEVDNIDVRRAGSPTPLLSSRRASDGSNELYFDAHDNAEKEATTTNNNSKKNGTTSSLEILNGVGPEEDIPVVNQNEIRAPPNNGLQTSENNNNYHSASQSDPEQETVIDFLKDDPKDMTYGRRIGLSMMRRFAWYNPQLKNDNDDGRGQDDVVDGGKFRTEDGYPIRHSKEETPSLEKAWAYFDHVALPRYLFVEKANPNEKKPILRRIINKWSKKDKQLQRAEPGEAHLPTRLYSPLFTPHKQLGDFGLGIGLYFSTIRAMTILVLIVGIIHIPNFMFFSGPDYSNNQPGVPSLLRGSAICTETEWVVCETCLATDFKGDSWLYDPETNTTFARHNLCDGATLVAGMVNFSALCYVLIAAFVVNYYFKMVEQQMDEDEQTAQDYSIVIDNPPEDATDPQEWREYFKSAFDAHVTACTVAVDNDLLVRTLVERREKMRMLELMVEPGTSLDIVTLAGIAAGKERERNAFQKLMAMVVPGFPEIFARMAVLTAKVQGLAQQDYPVTNIFVTFETEGGQRKVLEKLTVGQAAIDTNRQSSVRDVKYLFRGFRVLSVHEPEEPDSIRWEDLNVTFYSRMKQQFFTGLCTVAALVVVVLLVNVVNETNPIFTAYTIAIVNALFPTLAKALSYSEAHPSHGSLQTSLYFKIAIFRWVTTAIVITVITPFEDTLFNGKGGLILQVQAQFMAEITTTAAVQLLDPVGHLQRHFLAPRAKTQDAMNLNMQGSKFELAERYTAVAKLLFLTFWYCAIYPGTFFFCAFSLQVIYFMDRLSLMRTWKRVPKLGIAISKFNRTYFLPLSMLAMAVFSSYYWSGFPFDNLCKNDETTTAEQSKSYTIPVYPEASAAAVLLGNVNQTTLEEPEYYENFTITSGAYTFRYCLQDFLRTKGRQTYPFVAEFQEEGQEWMTEEQETVTTIYGWSSFGFFCLFCLIIITTWAYSIYHYFQGSYVPCGDDQGQNFSELEAVSIYVPQVESPVFSYPLLACTVDDMDKDMLDWTDPEHPHAFYDLTKDAQALIRGSDISQKVVFSQVGHWPPETKKTHHVGLSLTPGFGHIAGYRYHTK